MKRSKSSKIGHESNSTQATRNQGSTLYLQEEPSKEGGSCQSVGPKEAKALPVLIMNSSELAKQEAVDIRNGWFKDHVAFILGKKDDDLIKIRWREPGSSNYYVIYLIDTLASTVCVYGDLGEAVYMWHGGFNGNALEFLSRCSLSYFNGKCSASSCGERGKIWNDEIAKSNLQYEFKVREEEYEKVIPESDKRAAYEACGMEHEWHDWLRDNGMEVFGDSYYERFDIGRVISNRVHSHLIGLQMIQEGIEDGRFQYQKPDSVWKRIKSVFFPNKSVTKKKTKNA